MGAGSCCAGRVTPGSGGALVVVVVVGRVSAPSKGTHHSYPRTRELNEGVKLLERELGSKLKKAQRRLGAKRAEQVEHRHLIGRMTGQLEG